MDKLVSKAQRFAFWKFQHAEQCMGMVVELCAAVPKYGEYSKVENTTDLYSKIISIYMLYGRPFKQSPNVRLDITTVPTAKHDFHNSLISFRDKMFAHVDVGAKAILTDDGEELAKMIIHNTGNELLAKSFSLIPTQHGLKDISDLALEIRTFCQGQLATMFVNKVGVTTKIPIGLLKVNLSNAELAPLLVPIDD